MLVLFIILFVIISLGGAGGYLFYLRNRPRKKTWIAKVYVLGEGIQDAKKNAKGEIISNIRLKDLKPYKYDVIEKFEKKPGMTIYRLQKLNIAIPPVEGNVVDYWGLNNSEITVLLDGGTACFLKKGYDANVGEMIFQPMPMSLINMMKSEIVLRKDRLKKEEKDILKAIMPLVTIIISFLALVSVSYIVGSSLVKINELHLEKMELFENKEGNFIKNDAPIIEKPVVNVNPLGFQDKINPPLIEGDESLR
jgi:hypothetical protein